MTQALSLPLSPGDVVDGKFRVEALIGQGGMGIVVAATHLFLREPVALKFLRPELLRVPEIVARFAFEARAAAKVKSEHVARVLDVGEVNGVPFMVIEHLDGRDLGSRVAESGPLTLREASEYVIQACEALAGAHAAGIVHRDVKPENLFLVERGGYRSVKLIDFGISKAPEPLPPSGNGSMRVAATADEIALFETGEMMGSPSYMSPEQLTGRRLDSRSDLWALGAVFYELLTGKPLFDPYRPLRQIVSSILHDPIPSVLNRRPDLPLAVAGVLSRCLARDPDLRFQSAAELAVALLPFAPRRSREAAERAVSQVRSSGGSDQRLALPASELPGAPTDTDSIWLLPENTLRSALRPAPLPRIPTDVPDLPPIGDSDPPPSVAAPTVKIDREVVNEVSRSEIVRKTPPKATKDWDATQPSARAHGVARASADAPLASDSAPATSRSLEDKTTAMRIPRPAKSSRLYWTTSYVAIAAAAAAIAFLVTGNFVPRHGAPGLEVSRVGRSAPAMLVHLGGAAEPSPAASIDIAQLADAAPTPSVRPQ